MRTRARVAAAAWVVAAALVLPVEPGGTPGAAGMSEDSGAPVGGFGQRSCMADVYEALGIWAVYPSAVAALWAFGCAWQLTL